jgi:transcriptional regulator with XRE-family HTH domain
MFGYDLRRCTILPGRALEQTEKTKTRKRITTARRFGRHLQQLRARRGLTQARLAERSDLSADAICRLEAGTFSPTLETLAKLAHGLDLSLATLFTGLERGRDLSLTLEIADYLRTRTPKERDLAWRLLRALFDD